MYMTDRLAAPPPRIAVIGAGPGGLVLARILHFHGIHATVFERDSSAQARAQGGVLDMHADGGQFALNAAGLREGFLRLARYGDQDLCLYSPQGERLVYKPTDPTDDHPELDRPDLRQLLLQSLPPEVVHWNHALAGIEQTGPGAPVTLQFRDHPAQVFDLVVGADGAWSHVRSLLSPAQPEYLGVLFYELHVRDVAERHPELRALVGNGSFGALGDRRGLLGHPTATRDLHVYAGLWTGDLPWDMQRPLTRAEVAQLFPGWAPSLLALIEHADEPMLPRPLYGLPIGHRWPHRAGLTLLGDAAHLMSPFSGEGANLAMRDGADLAIALVGAIGAGRSYEDAVRRYEEVMIPRAAAAAALAKKGLLGAFGPEGMRHAMNQFEAFSIGPA